MGECTLEFIKNAADRCAYVTEACADNYEYIDYYRMHYCVFNEGLYFTIPILLIVLYILFYLISDTTNRYLSPALTILSDKLGMSQNLAGVTFLALGNGAPDVISSIVGSEDDSLVFALGALIGAGVFVTTVVFSTVVFFSGKIKVNKKLFIRDIALYLFSIIILNIFGYNRSVNIYEAIGFFSLYVINVVLAVWQDIQEKKIERLSKLCEETSQNDQNSSAGIPEIVEMDSEIEIDSTDQNQNSESIVQEKNDGIIDYENIAKCITHKVIKSQFVSMIGNKNDSNNNNIINHDINYMAKKEKLIVDNPAQQADAENKSFRKMPSVVVRENLINEHFYSEENSSHHPIASKKKIKSRSTVTNFVNIQFSSLKYRLKRNYFNSQESFEDLNILNKINFVFINVPFTFLRDLTVPNLEIEKWNRIFFILMPLTCPLFVMLITKYLDDFLGMEFYILLISFAFQFLLSILFCKFTYRARLPPCISLVCIFSMCMSIFWIWFLATNLVDSLKFIGVIFDIPSSFLAMTVLSFGNSIPDLSLNAALAKAGFGQMGIAGSIAGPLFNLLIGLGASLIRKCIKNGGTIEFEFFSHGNLVVIVAIAVLFMNLLRLMIQAYLIKFRLNKSVSAIGYVLYSLFFIAICVITFAFGE